MDLTDSKCDPIKQGNVEREDTEDGPDRLKVWPHQTRKRGDRTLKNGPIRLKVWPHQTRKRGERGH